MAKLSRKLRKSLEQQKSNQKSTEKRSNFVKLLNPTLENTKATKRTLGIGFNFNRVPREGEEYLIYVINCDNGYLTVHPVKTSEVQEVICLPGDGYVVRTKYCDYIIIVAHQFNKRPLEGLVHLAVAFYGRPIPHYGAYLRKIDFTHDGKTVGMKLVQTSPVKDVKFLTDNICVTHTENNTYIVLLGKASLARDSSTL